MKELKRHLAMVFAYTFMFVLVCSNVNVFAFSFNPAKITDTKLQAISNQLVIKVKDINASGYQETIKKYNGQIQEENENYILVNISSEEVDKLTAELNKDKNVEFTEVNAFGKSSGVKLDPLSETQDYLFYSKAIDACPLLTDEMKKKEIKVAVVDTGVKSSHVELQGRVLKGYNFVSKNTNTEDNNGHGTGVAGVIAAKHNNVGISGVAGLLNVKVLPVKVLDSKGEGTTFNISKGIIYAANQGAQIINVSINGKGYSKLINDAIQYAISKNSVVIVSAGNNGDYTNKYWPCNVKGAFVVGDSYGLSNSGKEVKVYTIGSGKTTDISSNGYSTVSGSSYSAAVVSAATAMLKVKYPSYSNEKIKNLLVKGSDNTNICSFNIKKTLSSTTDFIEITSPDVFKSTTGDVDFKVSALNPKEVKTLNVYVNESSKVYKTLTGNNSKEYSFTVAKSDLVEGLNCVKVVAIDKKGKQYFDTRYFWSVKAENVIKVTVKDTKGKPAPNMLVEIPNLYMPSATKSVITDKNGEAIFYKSGEEDANRSNRIVVRSADADKASNNIFYITDYYYGNDVVVDLSKDAKEVSIKALKADNKTPISKGNLIAIEDSNFKVPLSSNGAIKLLVNKNTNFKFAVYSETEGYYYEKNVTDINSISSITLKKDETVSKIDITNSLDSQIKDETLTISKSQNLYGFIEIGTFNVKNKTLYVSNGDYYYTYNTKDKSGKPGINYYQENINITEDTTISYGVPALTLEENYGVLYLIAKDKTHRGAISKDVDLKVTVKDPSGKTLTNNKDYTFTKDSMYGLNSVDAITLSIKNLQSGNYSVEASINYMGKSIVSNTLSIKGNTAPIKETTKVDYKIPKELQTLLAKDGSGTANLEFYVYNKNTKETVYHENSKKFISTDGSATANIPSIYATTDYNVFIAVSGKSGGVFYDRNLSKGTDGKITINNHNNTTKKIDFKESDGSILKNSSVGVFKEIQVNGRSYTFRMFQSVTNKEEVNIWADPGTYTLSVNGENTCIDEEFNITESNSKLALKAAKYSKVKIVLPKNNIKSFAHINFFRNDNYAFGRVISENTELLISPNVSLKETYLVIQNFRAANDLNANYTFDTNIKLQAGKTQTLDFNNFNVTYTKYPKVITKDGQYEFAANITNGTLTLKQYFASSSKGNNDEIANYGEAVGTLAAYDSKGKLVKSFAQQSMKENNNLYYISNLSNGDYTFKLSLYGLQLKDAGIKVKVSK
ncbi:MAG: S8 family serine peptidase [Clostridiaceae bacterium]